MNQGGRRPLIHQPPPKSFRALKTTFTNKFIIDKGGVRQAVSLVVKRIDKLRSLVQRDSVLFGVASGNGSLDMQQRVRLQSTQGSEI